MKKIVQMIKDEPALWFNTSIVVVALLFGLLQTEFLKAYDASTARTWKEFLRTGDPLLYAEVQLDVGLRETYRKIVLIVTFSFLFAVLGIGNFLLYKREAEKIEVDHAGE